MEKSAIPEMYMRQKQKMERKMYINLLNIKEVTKALALTKDQL